MKNDKNTITQPKPSFDETNQHYCIEVNSIHKPIVEPIVGKMIIGDNLVNYLFDGGSDITIKNQNLFNKKKSMYKPYRTNQLITTDLAGLFKISVRGNKYLLILKLPFLKINAGIRAPEYPS